MPKSSSVDYTGKLVTATGWYDNKSKSSFTFILKSYIDLPIWTNEESAKAYVIEGTFRDNFICAGEYENGTHRDCTNNVRWFYIYNSTTVL